MPELRKDPVTKEWVIIATERSRRPNDFRHADESAEDRPEFVDNCPFCPGNEAMTPPEVMAYRSEQTEPDTEGWWIRVVPNKFPALSVEGELNRQGFGMYDMMNGIGAHEVIVETPKHNVSPASLAPNQFKEVIWAYRDRFIDLSHDKRFKYILIFRNHGKVAGASLEHPHSQLVALPMVPMDVQLKIDGAARYYDHRERCVYCDMIRQEETYGKRVVFSNEHFVVFTPFASKFPFETWVMPRHHAAHFAQETHEMLNTFAEAFQEIMQRLNVALSGAPYNYMLHTAPVNTDREPMFHWHLVIVPRLTIAAGFEMGTGIYINVTSPEDAAEHLRNADPTQAAKPAMAVH